MSRTPKPIRPAGGFAGPGADLGDPPPVETYPLKRGARPAVPDRTRTPVIGPACGDTRQLVEGESLDPTPRFTDELRSGIEMGTTRGNDEPVPKTAQEYSNAVTEARHGQATRPPRPGGRGQVGTTRRAVSLPTEKSNGDMPSAGGPESPGRGEGADGTAEIPDRRLDVRDR